jgi:hypothetical protein
MKEQKIIHGRQKSFHPTQTLCGIEWPHDIPEHHETLEIPEPRGINPIWITCSECRKKLALPDMTKALVL